jgi:hypothetical protein
VSSRLFRWEPVGAGTDPFIRGSRIKGRLSGVFFEQHPQRTKFVGMSHQGGNAWSGSDSDTEQRSEEIDRERNELAIERNEALCCDFFSFARSALESDDFPLGFCDGLVYSDVSRLVFGSIPEPRTTSNWIVLNAEHVELFAKRAEAAGFHVEGMDVFLEYVAKGKAAGLHRILSVPARRLVPPPAKLEGSAKLFRFETSRGERRSAPGSFVLL